MQHCGNCGALLNEDDLRQGRCPVCLHVVTPDIETVPISESRNYRKGEMNEPASHPFGVAGDAAEARKLRVSVHGQIGIEHGGGIEIRVPEAPPRRRGWIFLLGLLLLLFLVVAAALLFINPGNNNKAARQSQTATMAAHATGTAVDATTTAALPTATATAIGGATTVPQPGGGPGVPTATPATSGTVIVGNPTTAPAITATPLPTATQAPNNPPALYMNPTAVRFTLCLIATSASFTIKNTGGSTLKWNALSSDYTLQPPTQGTLSANQSTTITVSGILLGGSVTVNATDLGGHSLPTSPQTFTVVCTA